MSSSGRNWNDAVCSAALQEEGDPSHVETPTVSCMVFPFLLILLKIIKIKHYIKYVCCLFVVKCMQVQILRVVIVLANVINLFIINTAIFEHLPFPQTLFLIVKDCSSWKFFRVYRTR